MYGGISLRLDADGSGYVRQEIGRAAEAKTVLKEKIANWKATVEYRLVVKDATMTTFVNGQQIHTEKLPLNPDPWLAIETHDGRQNGIVQNFQILGSPTIPRSIDLAQGAALDGWSAAYYGENVADGSPGLNRGRAAPTSQWSRQGDEIVASKLPRCEGSFRESVLQYHRPLLDDCEVEYEFFYEPGKTEVHPAIDRLALLLRPEGVQIHRLTDAQYDRTGLAPDNATPLPGSKPVPLKAGEWNKLKLTLAGDRVAVEVNGVEIGRTELTPTNQRIL